MTAEEYRQGIERHWRRNLAVFVAWEFLWGLGMPFAMFATFAPAYLSALAAPKWLLGVVLASPAVCSAAQIIVSYHVPPRLRLWVFGLALVICLLPLFTYAAFACFWGNALPLPWHWALYGLAQCIFAGGNSAIIALYWEIMTDNIPLQRRGLLFGLRMAAIGVTGLAMSYAAAQMLTRWPAPFNFRLSLFIGIAIFLASCAILVLLRDQINPVHALNPSGEGMLLAAIKTTLCQLWENANYRVAISLLSLLAIATNIAPFIVAAARDVLRASDVEQGWFSPVYLAATAVFGWVLGFLGDRYGYRTVACICSGLLAVAFLLCLTQTSLGFWYAAYGSYALVSMASGMLLCNLSAELFPAVPPNRLMALGNIILLPFGLASAPLAGAVVDWSGSYQKVFLVTLIFALAALAGFAFLFREPRQRHRRYGKGGAIEAGAPNFP